MASYLPVILLCNDKRASTSYSKNGPDSAACFLFQFQKVPTLPKKDLKQLCSVPTKRFFFHLHQWKTHRNCLNACGILLSLHFAIVVVLARWFFHFDSVVYSAYFFKRHFEPGRTALNDTSHATDVRSDSHKELQPAAPLRRSGYPPRCAADCEWPTG